MAAQAQCTPTTLKMKPLSNAEAAAFLRRHTTTALQTDSRSVKPGDGFIALLGYQTDGRQHVAAALTAGASGCLVETDGVDAFAFNDPRIACVTNLKANLGAIAHAFYGKPSAALKVIASTGTNGKTSTAWWMAQALTLLGARCGVIGTLGVGMPGSTVSTGLTTPDAVTMHRTLRQFADADYRACALEASSIGLVEHRLNGVQIDVALFTNFTQDHLDYHGTMDAYWQAKRNLFSWPNLQAAVINIDDTHGAQLAVECLNSRLSVFTVSTSQPATLVANNINFTPSGVTFSVVEGGESAAIKSILIGEYNVSNLLVVLGGLRALGYTLADAAAVAVKLTPVPGRLEPVEPTASNTPSVIVDYAHTPDALEKVLQALQPVAAARGGRLWCVFGCGGNRDASKRPRMGGIAARLADNTIITSDNPRLEAPATILAQILAGASLEQGTGNHVEVIEDRATAVAHAISRAAANDVVLLAGKGHEDYQDLGGAKRPYSDFVEAGAALKLRAESAST